MISDNILPSGLGRKDSFTATLGGSCHHSAGLTGRQRKQRRGFLSKSARPVGAKMATIKGEGKAWENLGKGSD